MHHNRSLLPNVEVLLGVLVKTSTCSNKLLFVILNFDSRLLMCLHVHYKCAFKIAPLITQLQLFSGEGGREVASSGVRPLA